MPFLNTTTNILKIRNSSNGAFTEIGNIYQANLALLSKAGGTMTGQLLIDDSSSSSTPALSFDTDTDLGLFRKSANVMGFSSSGTEQMFFDANGITLNNENEVRFSEATGNGTNYISIKTQDDLNSSYSLILPSDPPTNNKILKSDSNGNLSWTSVLDAQINDLNDAVFYDTSTCLWHICDTLLYFPFRHSFFLGGFFYIANLSRSKNFFGKFIYSSRFRFVVG